MEISRARSGARILGLALAALALAVPAAQAAKPAKKAKTLDVQLLGFNDFHGNLQPFTTGGIRLFPQPVPAPPSPVNVPAGGAAFLADYVREREALNPNTLVVSAGDLIGASPLLSALYHDEPTIEAMNLIGLDINAVGNHEFDEGADELQRMQNGGCHPTDGCKDGDGFAGADFPFLAANVIDKTTGETIFRPYVIKRFKNVKVGFIGMTLEGTPDIVSPAGISNLKFLDEAETANRYAAELKRKHGVQAIVVVLHEGGVQSVPFNTTTYDSCTGVSGAIVDIVKNTSLDVDMFMTGHTHQPYNCAINADGTFSKNDVSRRALTSAASAGRLLTDIDLKLDRRTRDVASISHTNVATFNDENHAPEADVQSLINRYDTLSAPLRRTPVGKISSDITTTLDDSRENAMGNLIADAQLADTDDADRGDADIALMNPGGVRANLTFLQPPNGTEGNGVVTYEEAFTVQPFNNIVTTQTFTGAQIMDVLKDQWCSGPRNVLLPSASLTYTYDVSAADALVGNPPSIPNVACGPNVANPASNVKINGQDLVLTQTYRVTTNNFLADGGDSFQSLRQGTNRTSLSDFDVDSLVRYLQPSLAAGAPAIAPPALDRINVVP